MRKQALVVFTYLVTRDIVETLERKIDYNLTNKLRDEIRLLEVGFLSEFWQYLPSNLNKEAISASSISRQIGLLVNKSSLPVVSLDRVYLADADYYLEITRLTNPNTGEVTISQRPGNETLERQIEGLKDYKNIILADVGAFEGDTLIKICELIEDQGIVIDEIILGVSSNKANNKINNNRKLTSLNLFDFYEWIEMRDLFGIDGRSVGMKDGKRQYIPYWENLSGWASISKENESEVVNLCKKYYNQLKEMLIQEKFDFGKIGIPIKYGGE